jgi:hypothetical protein
LISAFNLEAVDRARASRAIAIAVLLFSASACTPPPPVQMAPQFTPSGTPSWTASGKGRTGDHATGACVVELAGVRDMRADPESMGAVGSQVFQAADTAGWVRSGFQSLGRDPRIKFVDKAAPADPALLLNVELLKAYVTTVTSETHAATVVLRVHYSGQNGMRTDQVYRGTDNGVTWLSAGSEGQSSFNAALTEALEAIDRDILARCG